MMHWLAHLNGYLQFLIALPFIVAVFLGGGLIVSYATEKEMENFKRKFREKNGRDPLPEEYPDPYPYGPSLN